MKCKECEFYSKGYSNNQSKNDGMCYHPDIPFASVDSQNECLFEQTKLRCNICKYWVEAQGFTREDDCGGCTYGGGFMPMFINSACALKKKYRIKVEKEMLSQ